MYFNVYTRFKAYHEGILFKYRLIFQEKERQEINRATKEVRTFFIYICQMLIMQIIYQGSLVIQREYASELWVLTLADVINTLLMISYILMYIGLSLSIQKAFSAEQKNRNRYSSVNENNLRNTNTLKYAQAMNKMWKKGVHQTNYSLNEYERNDEDI